MSEERTQHRCIAPDEFTTGRCPECTTHPSRLCGGHRAVANRDLGSLIEVDENLPDAPILREMKWVACEARALQFSHTDPERSARFEQRKRDLLDAMREW